MSVLDDIVAAADPALAPHAVDVPGPERFGAVGGVRGFVLEAVYEGYLMHYGEPRAFSGMDEDLRLLAGDSLYALGLSRLAAEGDLEAVAVLSDLISGSAQAEAEGRREEYELLVELILEGYRLHYRGAGEVVQPDDDDLSLLLGDQLYAMGLERLAALGDLDAVVELADVISLSAQAHAQGDEPRAAAAWEAAGHAVGHGRS